MRRLLIGLCAVALGPAVVPIAAPRAETPRGVTRLELSEHPSGRRLYAGCLAAGEEIVLTWTNSLFKLKVTEGLAARNGRLELSRVTFADPQGAPPPRATPADLDDLYHTGGPFTIDGLARPLSRVVFRISEIGDPHLTIGDRTLAFKEEVGFGGAVLMEARPPRVDQGECLP